MNLKNNETEIPEDQLEECALKLDAKVSEIVEFLWCHSGLCFGVVFPETFMSTVTFGSSIAVWFMKNKFRH